MRWFRFVSLRLQIILLVLSFTLAVGLGNAWRAHLALDDLAREQFERRGVATALALATQSTDLLLTNDLFGLFELLNNTLVNTPDVRYIMVLDGDGAVRAHTFGPGVPRGLAEANSVAPSQAWHVRRLNTDEGPVIDVAAPLPEGQPGLLRLGMSEQAITATVDRHTWQLVGLMALSLLPVLVVTYLLGRMLTTPLLKLVDAANAIRRGELTRQVPVAGRDEVAQLSHAFNEMTQALAQSQTALQTSNQALQTRNQELAALYAVATAIAQADTIDSLIEAALAKSLEVMGLSAGWVFLFQNDSGGPPTLRVTRGLPDAVTRQLADSLPPCCLPDPTAPPLQEAIIAHRGQPCPCLSTTKTPHLACHATVPLKSRRQVWGAMHLACTDPGCFTPAQLRLLTAIGGQIGMAVDNAHLAETQRRQSIRRLLLDSVLKAQEEERKRIARELHDELAQNLAVLIRDLEDVTAPSETPGMSRLQGRIRDTRTLARRILEQTRRLIFDLRPSALDDLGLLPALRHYAQHHLEAARINVQITVSGAKRRLPPEIETALFRIAQEAITNVVRHANATQVQLDICFETNQITLAVADNGIGFNPNAPPQAAGDNPRVGLLGMRERAELLGGTLKITGQPGVGVSVQAKIPLEVL